MLLILIRAAVTFEKTRSEHLLIRLYEHLPMTPRRIYICLCLFLLPVFTAGCNNPFAPGELEGDPFAELLGDPSTIEGFYTRFQKAYELRDTSLYGPLIHPDFTFTYRDDERNVDVTWGRSEEMNSTYNMFSQSYDINVRWNNITQEVIEEDQAEAQVIRRFNLSVVLSPSEPPLRSDGSASFRLTRSDSTADWRLVSWRDESDI
ncbi:hypothetical protein [Natronogracilivirga saccharolytica]|uniref:Uncharacterized protein n=1 Tax=Natronogracilivirga saccharolytica TaxID=2812953 RepID=A0A8J7S7Z7_9BACT|nr:hypothetical protein [Natronogracilivirga saccharolytica]MBP3193618.1 hypothetical protein [Natronogracilivirga saccharolytica]